MHGGKRQVDEMRMRLWRQESWGGGMNPPLGWNPEQETDLAQKLHATYRKWAGNMGLGGHLPETWNAVAQAAREAIAKEATDE